LLDTHALYWLVSGEQELSQEALVMIGECQAASRLFVSPISAWELSVAVQKGQANRRPYLGEDSPERWFREAVRAIEARIVPIKQRVACEAAQVVTDTGHKDPGDCFLMATARVSGLLIITRDAILRDIAAESPDYLSVLNC
jgi:PIN domain nuclease of toxin-antitoxin system